MKLRISRRAQQQASRMAMWWAEHRPAVPTLFTEELERTFRLLVETPGAGVNWPTPKRPQLRRALMPQTANHVYFQVVELIRFGGVLLAVGGGFPDATLQAAVPP